MLRSRPSLLVVTATLTTLFLGPMPAHAASLSKGTLSIVDDAGHDAVFVIGTVLDPLDPAHRGPVIVDADIPIDAPTGCGHPAPPLAEDQTVMVCDGALVSEVLISLGDGDDTLSRASMTTVLPSAPVAAIPLEITGGPGNDVLEGGDDADLIKGGDGDDHILGFSGDDTLVGGLGADHVEPGIGTNLVDVSSAEADTVTVTAGSLNRATASANDLFVGAGATTTISLVGVDPTADDWGTDTGAVVQAGNDDLPSIADLLGGVRSVVASGTAPAGVTLPTQPLITSLSGIAGHSQSVVRRTLSATLPLGMTLDAAGLHITATCAAECDLFGGGVIDTGAAGVVALEPGMIKVGAATTSTLRLGLTDPVATAAVGRALAAGRCIVVVARLRVRTRLSSEPIVYTVPACGSKLRLRLNTAPTASKQGRGQPSTAATARRVAATATCSAACVVAPRFLLVKRGRAVVARVRKATVRPATGAGSDRTRSITWKLSAKQGAAIARASRSAPHPLRYIVSTQVTSGGVTTTSTTTFNERGT